MTVGRASIAYPDTGAGRFLRRWLPVLPPSLQATDDDQNETGYYYELVYSWYNRYNLCIGDANIYQTRE